MAAAEEVLDMTDMGNWHDGKITNSHKQAVELNDDICGGTILFLHVELHRPLAAAAICCVVTL